jgi:hypothetical protein
MLLTPAMKQMQQYQLAYISKGALSKKKIISKQQPSSISTIYEKTFCLEHFLIYRQCRR